MTQPTTTRKLVCTVEVKHVDKDGSKGTYTLWHADPDCAHAIEFRWSGYGCKHCTGWFCL